MCQIQTAAKRPCSKRLSYSRQESTGPWSVHLEGANLLCLPNLRAWWRHPSVLLSFLLLQSRLQPSTSTRQRRKGSSCLCSPPPSPCSAGWAATDPATDLRLILEPKKGWRWTDFNYGVRLHTLLLHLQVNTVLCSTPVLNVLWFFISFSLPSFL